MLDVFHLSYYCVSMFSISQSCRLLLNQKGEAVECSRAEDSLRPLTETTTDSSDGNSHSDTGLQTDVNSMLPTISLARLQMQTDNLEQENKTEPNPNSLDSTSTGSAEQDLSLHSKEEETTSQVSAVQESLGELLPAETGEELISQPAAEPINEAEEEIEAPAVPGRKNGTAKAKATPKRRSGRATNRR